MGGMSSVFAALFGVLWTVIAFSIGGGIFALFGVFFIGFAIVSAVYNFKNASSQNRYSQFDIVDSDEEPDPFDQRLNQHRDDRTVGGKANYCPYCGTKADLDHSFCSNCGRRLS